MYAVISLNFEAKKKKKASDLLDLLFEFRKPLASFFKIIVKYYKAILRLNKTKIIFYCMNIVMTSDEILVLMTV